MIRLTFMIGCLLLAGGVQAQTRELSSSGDMLDGIAAIVNDGVVLKSELQNELQTIVARLQAQGTPLPPANQLTSQVLERLVNQRIQLQRAERVGIQVSDETLNGGLSNIAARNGVTLAQLPEILAREGVNYSAYREEMRNQMAVEQLRQRDVISRIAVSPTELEEFLERQEGRAYINQEFKISQILVSLSANASPEAIADAEREITDLLSRASAGEPFAELAVAYSDGQKALEGGDLGWRRGEELPTLFADVVPGLELGQISEPIRSASGFHLVRLDDRRGGERIMEEQTHARHILLIPNEVLDDTAVQSRLAEIRQQILDGDDFEAVAKAVSEDPVSAVDGGDLGWTGPGDLVPNFQAMCDSLAINEVSEPFKTPYGWHVVQVLDRRVHDTTDENQREQAIMAIRNSKFAEETELWTRRLRDQAFVEYRL